MTDPTPLDPAMAARIAAVQTRRRPHAARRSRIAAGALGVATMIGLVGTMEATASAGSDAAGLLVVVPDRTGTRCDLPVRTTPVVRVIPNCAPAEPVPA